MLVAEPDEWDRWAGRLMVQLSLGTGSTRLTAMGVGRGAAGRGRAAVGVRAARALPDRMTSGLPHIRGEELLARWMERTESDGRRHLVLGGHPVAVPWPDREKAQEAVANALDGAVVVVCWESPMGR